MCRSTNSVQDTFIDVFRRLGLTRESGGLEHFQCPVCRRWNDVSLNHLTGLVDCSCGWGGDVFSVVMAGLDVDATVAIKLVEMVHDAREAGAQ